MSSRLSLDNIRQFYPEDKYILLLPPVSKHTADDNPLWALDVATVKIDPNNKRHVYLQNGEMALTKIAFDLLASAADLTVKSSRSKGDEPGDVIHTATATMATAGGGKPRARDGSSEWEFKVQRDRVWNEAEAFIYKGNVGGKNDEQINEMIQRRFNDEWQREREKGKCKNESKAFNRAISAILACQRAYPKAELEAKEFAIAKWVLSPNMSDPEARSAYISAGVGAASQLYPGQPAQIAAGAQVEALPYSPEVGSPCAPVAPIHEAEFVSDEALQWDDPKVVALVNAISTALLDYTGEDRGGMYSQFGKIRQAKSVSGLVDFEMVLADKGAMGC